MDDPMRRPEPDDRKPEIEPVNVPLRLRQKLIKDIRVGETAWVDSPWFALNNTGHLYLRMGHPPTTRWSPGSIKVRRTKDGFHARLPLIFRPRWKLGEFYDRIDAEKVTKITYRLHPLGDLLFITLFFLGGLICGVPDSPPTQYEITCTDLESRVLLIDRGTNLKFRANHWEWESTRGETGVDLMNRRCSYTEVSEPTE